MRIFNIMIGSKYQTISNTKKESKSGITSPIAQYSTVLPNYKIAFGNNINMPEISPYEGKTIDEMKKIFKEKQSILKVLFFPNFTSKVLSCIKENPDIGKIQLASADFLLKNNSKFPINSLTYILKNINNNQQIANTQLNLAKLILKHQPKIDSYVIENTLNNIKNKPQTAKIQLKLANLILQSNSDSNMSIMPNLLWSIKDNLPTAKMQLSWLGKKLKENPNINLNLVSCVLWSATDNIQKNQALFEVADIILKIRPNITSENLSVILSKTENYKAIENIKKFLKPLNLQQLSKCSENTITTMLFMALIDNNINKLTLKEKVKLQTKLNNILNSLNIYEKELFGQQINIFYTQLIQSKDKIITVKQTGKKIPEFFNSFFQDKNLTMLNSNDLLQYSNSGIPLKHSRKNFINKLNSLLNNLTAIERQEILNKIEIEITEETTENNSEKIYRYNGILTDSKLDTTNQTEAEIKTLIQQFLYANTAKTGNTGLNDFLNKFIQAFPEWINVIGKKQYETHSLTTDVHILEVLKKAVNNPLYQELSPIDKMVLKLAVIFHDIAKSEGAIDAAHPQISAMYTRDLLKKVNLPNDLKKRIVEMVKNHHWFGDLNKGDIAAEKAAWFFRRPEDLKIASIIADADLRSVNPTFQNEKIENLTAQIYNVQEAQNRMYSTGNFTYTTELINPKLIKPNKQGYRVVNLVSMPDDFDLGTLGFNVKSKRDFSVNVHCTDTPMDIIYLSDVTNNADICASNIDLLHLATYNNQAYGVGLRTTNQTNITNSWFTTQGSGREKGINSVIAEVFGYNRTFRRNHFLQKIQELSGQKMTIEEYAQFYKKVITRTKYLSHIKDFSINDKIFTKEQILEAMKFTDNKIRENNDEIKSYDCNETNIYTPEPWCLVAKVNSFEELLQKARKDPTAEALLATSKQTGLPILILGDE